MLTIVDGKMEELANMELKSKASIQKNVKESKPTIIDKLIADHLECNKLRIELRVKTQESVTVSFHYDVFFSSNSEFVNSLINKSFFVSLFV